MAARPTAERHHVRRDARLLRLTPAPRGSTQRIADHKRKALARFQRRLDAEPLAAMRDSLIVSIANGRLLLEQADTALMQAADLRTETGLAKFAGWLGNRVRRDCELLLVLEEKLAQQQRGGTVCGTCGLVITGALEDYLAHSQACRAQPRPPVAAEEPTP